ncbi:MAG: RDD family protein [Promethearchaeota archaeon]|jgi:uncharacterized RDD family membrane protein YckC
MIVNDNKAQKDKLKSIFMSRAVAFLIDIGILYPTGYLIAIILIQVLGAPVNPFETYIRAIICFSIPVWIYSIGNDFSKSGSTIGKKIIKIHVVTLENERLKLHQAISRNLIKLIPWEMVHLTFFGLSEGWGTFSIAQMISAIVTYVLIFFYVIIMIKTKGIRGIHDYLSHTQVKSVKDS